MKRILLGIGNKMRREGLTGEFVTNAIETALEFEGVYDLMVLYDEETDVHEKEEIIADIQDMLNECS